MPLSEDEQRILQDIERNFYEQDPTFAKNVGRPGLYRHASRNCKISAATFVVGLVILLVMFIQNPVIAFAGFLVMAASAGVFATNLKRIGTAGMLDVAESEPARKANASMTRFRAGLAAKFTRKRTED